MRNSSREMWSSGCTFWKESNASLISDRMSAHVTSNTPGLTSRLTSSAALGLRLAQKCTCSETKSEMRLGKASTRERLSIAIFRIARASLEHPLSASDWTARLHFDAPVSRIGQMRLRFGHRFNHLSEPNSKKLAGRLWLEP